MGHTHEEQQKNAFKLAELLEDIQGVFFALSE